MEIRIPISFDAIVDEIIKFTGLPIDDVRHRVWMEVLNSGWNVCQDVERFQVTPHKFDEKMINLYNNSYGFIFETMVFWATLYRQKWPEHALERLFVYARKTGVPPEKIRILIFGDGTGNDSLFLASKGFVINYYDIPGSKTFEFALKRFTEYKLHGNMINVITDYNRIISGQYDAIICFEVLEHLPDPKSFIRDLAGALKENGIILITEAFGFVADSHPTHLSCNLKYVGLTPIIFKKNGLSLTWYAPLFKPMEFTKKKDSGMLATLWDINIIKGLLVWLYRNIKNKLKKY
ncbi:MAG: class I SAM-dependent methyltransferase [Deltaproteobacteria bacterium]|nr:class I SAM-dependent methyltransferase [Deltaproteobacteria bacterium]